MEIVFENKFRKKILERGFNYFLMDMVKSVEIDGNQIRGKVEGNQEYDVELDIEENFFIDGTCSCPCEENCKHIAALLYYLNNLEPQVKISKSCSNEELVFALSEQEAKEYLLSIFNRYENIATKFKQKYTGINERVFINQFNAIISKYDYIDWRSTSNFYNDVNNILIDVIEFIPGATDVNPFLTISSYIIDKLVNLDIDDSDGTISLLVDRVVNIIDECFNNSKFDKRILNEFLLSKIESDDYWINYFMEIFMQYAEKQDLQNYLDYFDSISKHENYFYSSYLELFAFAVTNLYSDINIIKEKLKPYKTNYYIAKVLAPIYQEEGDIDSLFDLYKNSIGTLKEREFFDYLKIILIKQGRKLELIELLKSQLLKEATLDDYTLLKELIGKESLEFIKNNKIKSDIKCEIFDKNNEDELLLQTIVENDNAHLYEKYFDKLKKENFEIFYNYFASHYLKQLRYLNNRKDYRHFSYGIDKFITKYPLLIGVLKIINQEIKIKYYNRPALQDEFGFVRRKYNLPY